MSNPLKTLERVKGIEPSSSAWKAVGSSIISEAVPENQPQNRSLNVNRNFPYLERSKRLNERRNLPCLRCTI
jgi:hypothetical protein